MVKRKIITIDEEKCNGCGNCVTGCQEGALQIVDGKAKLVNEKFCDGFGDCIGECPTGALKIVEKETKDFDLEATKKHVKNIRGEKGVQAMLAAQQEHGQEITDNEDDLQACGCPGMSMKTINKNNNSQAKATASINSELQQWPVQIHLLSPRAPYFKNANLLVTADCVPVAYGDFQKLLKGKTIALGCPKLDNAEQYITKITKIIKNNDLKSITVARMEVPCCGGLVNIVKTALRQSDSDLKLKVINLSIEGEIIENDYI